MFRGYQLIETFPHFVFVILSGFGIRTSSFPQAGYDRAWTHPKRRRRYALPPHSISVSSIVHFGVAVGYIAQVSSGSYYDPGAQRSDKVRALFARIAGRYDLLNDIQSLGMHRRWKRRVISLTKPGPGERALDVCCGTGDIALALFDAGCNVTGVDFTQEMLRLAARRQLDRSSISRPRPMGGIMFLEGDAQALPFENRSFDIVTMGYGLRNLRSWERGVEEMVRVLAPGGRVAVLEFGKPTFGPWRGVYIAYLNVFVPVLGKLFCGDSKAYAYILESLKHYPGAGVVAEKMKTLGLKNVKVINLVGGAMTINFGEK